MNRNTLIISLSLALAACGSQNDADEPATQMTSVATAQAGDLSVELLTTTQLETGRTPVYVRVKTAAGQLVTDATISVTPMMSMMGGMNHSAPVIGAPGYASDGTYRCDVVFQMASGSMGTWSAKVQVARPGAAAVEATFANLTVTETGRAKTFTYTDPSTSAITKYVMSLGFKSAPFVGLNPVVVTLHRMQDMMTFVPVEGASLVLDPQMPSMGHGSPGNVNPTATAPGVYEGKLSFSMPGDWETTITATSAGVAIGAPKFATTF
jgi:hypothetical protein